MSRADPSSPAEIPPQVLTQIERVFEGLADNGPLVGLLMGIEEDRPVMEPAIEELENRGISFEVCVLSAHLDPRGVAEYASTARLRGLRVIICGASGSAALPGVVAAYTDLPVIGVPIRRDDLGGLDALLSVAQMPPGVPVAAMALNGSRNAALYAAKILAAGGGSPVVEL